MQATAEETVKKGALLLGGKLEVNQDKGCALSLRLTRFEEHTSRALDLRSHNSDRPGEVLGAKSARNQKQGIGFRVLA